MAPLSVSARWLTRAPTFLEGTFLATGPSIAHSATTLRARSMDGALTETRNPAW